MVSIVRTRVTLNVLVAVGLLLALIAVAISGVWIFQERIAFQPPDGPWPEAESIQRVEYRARDGQPLFAYIVGRSDSASGLLLSFHGNADLAIWQIDWAEEVVRRTGIMVMLAEYRGYMGLSGRPGYVASQIDAEAAYEFARDSVGISVERIAFFGHSLGSAIATELAGKHTPAALLLQSPFTSAREMAGSMTGYYPSSFLWRLISRLHFDTRAGVTRANAPVSVSHGGGDRLIPAQMGATVFAASRIQGQWLLVPTAGHNDVALRGGEAYWSWIAESLRSLSVAATR